MLEHNPDSKTVRSGLANSWQADSFRNAPGLNISSLVHL
jgi:hypothetical protein